jgi:hypothetical protein
MHAVVVRSTINDFEQGVAFLRDEVVPRVSQAPGFVAGYWVRLDGNQGTSMLVFDSEDTARTMARQIVGPPSGAVNINSVEVGEVAMHA